MVVAVEEAPQLAQEPVIEPTPQVEAKSSYHIIVCSDCGERRKEFSSGLCEECRTRLDKKIDALRRKCKKGK
jgi:hypothetical protein